MAKHGLRGMVPRDERPVVTPALVKRLARKRPESSIQAACLRVFAAYGIFCYPMNREKGGRNRARHVGFRGIPDIGGTLPSGRSFYCEVKRPGEKPSLDQLVAMKVLAKDYRAYVCLVHSVDEARDQAIEATRR